MPRSFHWITLCASLCAAFAMAGCESKPAEAPKADAQPAATVELTAQGQEFKPPIKPEQLPEGAWYCDMGTVHYARGEEGDHTCPICKMQLKHKTASR